MCHGTAQKSFLDLCAMAGPGKAQNVPQHGTKRLLLMCHGKAQNVPQQRTAQKRLLDLND
jgi:hypothetical protein